MSLIPFTILNIVGAAIWTLTATLLGYYIGQAVPHAEYYIVVVAIVVAIAVNLPPVKKLVDRFSKYLQNM
jgi:membrane protein DedA with SNARE-associated domain